ncbi:MAG TPA: phage tail tape measure protein [Stenotrophomonas sp.]|nr:phage tail tape measure protein [Stenotrophomonas sp.]
MADQNIGTARIDIEIDTSKVEPGVNRAKQSVSSLTTEVEQGSQRQVRATDRQIKALERQIATLGKDREEIIRWRIAQQASGEQAARLTSLLDKQVASMQKSAAASGQYRQALAMLPAQGTDIITSLAGGQNPALVLLQQGGQIRDQFGSASLAIRGVGTALAGLINPITLTAGAVAALALAWKSASDEQLAFQSALILTGGYAGKSVAELQALSVQLDRLDGVTRGGASDAIRAVAQSGRFAGEQFELVASAAARMEASAGQAIDSTVDRFKDIANDPVKALLKLNEAEHFLTQAQMERVRLLAEEGQAQEAASEGIRIYADHLDEVARRSEAALPATTQLWREVKDYASSVVGEVKTYADLLARIAAMKIGAKGVQGFGDLLPFTTLQQLQLLNAYGRKYLGEQGAAASTAGRPQHSPGRGAADTVVDTAAIEQQIGLEKQWSQITQQNLDKEAKKRKEINDAKEVGNKLGKTQAEIASQVASIEAKYADKTAANAAAAKARSDSNSAQALLESIERQITANKQLVDTGDKVTASDSLAIKAKQMLADASNHMTDSSRALLKAVLPELAASDQAAESYTRQTKAKEALARQNAIFEQQSANQRRGNEADLVQIGHGSEASELLRRQLDIRRAYEDELKRLGDRSVAADQDSWDAQAANAQRHLDEMLAAEREYQSQRIAMMGNWRNGASAAWEDYRSEAIDTASQTAQAWSNGFKGAQDALTEFAVKGKADVKGLVTSILADLARLEARKGLVAIGSMIAGAFTGAATSDNSVAIGTTTYNAKGGVYDSPSLSQYSSSIVNKPTLFAFAQGAGVMGEAGPEAIMPLRRGPDGRLGVSAAGGGGGGIEFNTNIIVQADGSSQTQTSGRGQPTGDEIARNFNSMANQWAQQQLRPGGLFHRQAVGA